MADIDPAQDLARVRLKTPYQKWLDQEGIPIHTGFFIEDLRTLEVKPWSRLGALGAFVILEGTDQQDDAYVLELSPGKSSSPERHLYEELIYVLQGRGATTVWTDEKKKQTFEWQTGSLFSPPFNAWHQHFNGSGSEPARLIAVTTAPVIINLMRDLDFVFNNPHFFKDRYAGEEDYFTPKGKFIGQRFWETNLVTDVRSFTLEEYRERGEGSTNMKFEMSNNSLIAHASEFLVGSYKLAHRHGPGAHVIIVGGEGYSLMWPEGEKFKKFDWHEGSVIVPPEMWYHQHFNTGNVPARYLALRWGSHKNPMGGKQYSTYLALRAGEDQIALEDQDPEVHRLFVEECRRSGVMVG